MDDEVDRLTPVALSITFYSFLGWIMHQTIQTPKSLIHEYDRKEYYDYYGKHVSLIHSLLSLFLSLGNYFYGAGVHYNESFSQLQIYLFGHSIGYFLYDMVYAEVFQIHDWAMRAHHIGTLMGGIKIYFEPVGGSAALMCLVVTEATNPCILKRNILRTQGEENSSYFKFIESTFAIFFILTRFFFGTFLSYNMWTSQISLMVKFTVSTVYGVGLFWIFIILYKLAKLMKQHDMGKGYWVTMDFLKNHQLIFWIGLMIWSFVLPFFLVYYFECGPVLFIVNGFTIV